MTKDYYQILNLHVNATPNDIRKAYRLYAQKFHPDKHQGDKFFEERFKEVNESYETLIDPDKRTEYDDRKFQTKPQAKEQETYSQSTSSDFSTGGYKPPENPTPSAETKEQKEHRELIEKRSTGCLIGLGTGAGCAILVSLGDGWHIPIAIGLLIWTFRQIFVVFGTFLKN